MRRILLILPLLAGLAAALALTMPGTARAWDIAALPAPYTIDSLTNVGAKTGECRTFYVVHWYDQSVTLGYGPMVNPLPNFSDDCNPHFQQQLDAFVDATINQTPPATTTAPTTSVSTTTTAPATTTTTAIPPVTTVVTVPPSTSTTVTTTPTDTQTVTVTTPASTVTVTLASSDDVARLQAQIDLLNQRQATDEARIYALEHPSGAIVGEPKNVAPFTNAAV